MKKPPIDKQEPPFRPGEKAGIFRAVLLIQHRKRRSRGQISCPHCGRRCEKSSDEPHRSRVSRLPFGLSPHGSRPATLFEQHIERSSRHLSTPPRLRGTKPDYLSTILGSLIAGYTDRFFTTLRRWPDLLQDPDVWKLTIGRWHKQKLDPNEGISEEARENLRQVGEALAYVKQGRWKLPKEEREAIIADYLKWRTPCKDLNEAFKQLWKQSEYESSELHRKEARGLLAEKHGISVKEVKTIERVLRTPSRRGNKSTPTEAILQMVALDHVNRDVKTIEKIWGDYLDEHPEESRKKSKLPTIPAAKRTPKQHPTPDP